MPATLPMLGDDVKSLPTAELVLRMDAIRRKAIAERYPEVRDENLFRIFEHGRVADLQETRMGQAMEDKSRRKLADMSFRFLIQIDMLMAAAGISNAILLPYNWSSPKFCINSAALGQYEIIAARISVECFFDLIHFVDKGKRLPDGQGKFKAFRKWITTKDNRFVCFVGHILEVFKLDRELGQPEVHGTSRYLHQILQLQPPTSEELNVRNRMTNVVINMWPNLVSVMNEIQPNSLSVFPAGEEFANYYFAALRGEGALDEFLEKGLIDFEK